MPNWKKLIKGKVVLSEAETAREWYSWYQGRWRNDYPELYNDRFKSYQPRYKNGMRTIPTRRRRRRLVATRASPGGILVTPARNVRARRSARFAHGPTGRGKSYMFGRSNVGTTVGAGTSKRCVTHSSLKDNLLTGTALISYELTDIEQGSALNQRERLIVNLRGFKIKMFMRNTHTEPICVNWAIISCRNSPNPLESDLIRASTAIREQACSAGSGMFRCFADINVDSYVVLKHKRVWLSESNPATTMTKFNTTGDKSSWYAKEFYYPLKRQLRYESSSKDSCVERLYFIAWTASPEDAVAEPQYTAGEISFDSIAYFKEPKN